MITNIMKNVVDVAIFSAGIKKKKRIINSDKWLSFIGVPRDDTTMKYFLLPTEKGGML